MPNRYIVSIAPSALQSPCSATRGDIAQHKILTKESIMNVSDIERIETIAATIEAWLETDESFKAVVSEESKVERKMNLSTFPITIKGFTKAFAKVQRKYNPAKGTTTLTLSTLAYNDDNDKVSTQRKTLSVSANGDTTWHITSPSNNGVILARWTVKRAMNSIELGVIENTIRKVNSTDYPLWGMNAAKEYAESLRGTVKAQLPSFEA